MRDNNIKKLPPVINRNGYEYLKLKENENAFIYIQIISEEENIYAYEVIKKKIRPKRLVYGKVISERECFPHDEAFGKWAWSFKHLSAALEKFRALNEKFCVNAS